MRSGWMIDRRVSRISSLCSCTLCVCSFALDDRIYNIKPSVIISRNPQAEGVLLHVFDNRGAAYAASA